MAPCYHSVSDEGVKCVSEEKLNQFIKRYIGIELWIAVDIFDTETKEIKSIVTKNHMSFFFYLNAPFSTYINFRITEKEIDDNIFVSTPKPNKYVSSFDISI